MIQIQFTNREKTKTYEGDGFFIIRHQEDGKQIHGDTHAIGHLDPVQLAFTSAMTLNATYNLAHGQILRQVEEEYPAWSDEERQAYAELAVSQLFRRVIKDVSGDHPIFRPVNSEENLSDPLQ